MKILIDFRRKTVETGMGSAPATFLLKSFTSAKYVSSK